MTTLNFYLNSSVNVYKYNKSMEELDLKKYYKIFPEKRNLKTNQENYTSSTSVNPRNDKHIYDKKPFNISTQNQDKIYNHQRRYTGEEYQCYNKNMNQSTNNGVNCSRDCTHTKYYNESCSSSLNLNINNINMNQSFNSLNRNKVDTIHNEINSPFPLAAETIASNAVNFRNTSLVLNCPVKLTSRYNSNMGNNTSVFSNYRMCSPRNDILLNSMDSDDWKMENETYKSSYLNPKPIRQYSSFNHDMTTSTPMSKGIVRKDSNQSINLLEEEAIMQD
ncbi:hypothetical protein A3Q56_07149 [Intoshia linei]|uniref:Uncharacterized protein n=1 Tax=Intoshia linei TaxID=1819745 RepID=A0A177AT30_9BILA|nr:hypothetical protein A3Q56_07149 [Intoshia linei]